MKTSSVQKELSHSILLGTCRSSEQIPCAHQDSALKVRGRVLGKPAPKGMTRWVKAWAAADPHPLCFGLWGRKGLVPKAENCMEMEAKVTGRGGKGNGKDILVLVLNVHLFTLLCETTQLLELRSVVVCSSIASAGQFQKFHLFLIFFFFFGGPPLATALTLSPVCISQMAGYCHSYIHWVTLHASQLVWQGAESGSPCSQMTVIPMHTLLLCLCFGSAEKCLFHLRALFQICLSVAWFRSRNWMHFIFGT